MPTYRVQTDTGILIVESPTPIASEAQMQQALTGGGQGLKITPERPEPPVSQGFFQRFNRGLAASKQQLLQETTQGVKARLLQAGWSEADASRKAASIGGVIQSGSPGSLADVGRALLPFLVNRFVPAGRTVGRMGGQLLGNVAGSAALEAGQAAVSGQSPTQGALTGARQGLPGGIAQAGIGGILGPNRATVQAQTARSIARLRRLFSPHVQAVLPQDPKAILSKVTTDQMVKVAGHDLDTMEQSIREALAPASTGKGQKNLQAKFDFLRERIKALRDVGEGPRTTPELRGAAKRASQEAYTLEQQLVTMLPPEQAKLYRSTLAQYAKDRANIRVLKAIQRTQNLPGGVNRADNLDMAEFVDALQAPNLGPAARGVFMTALVALRHPFMALHFARSGIGRGFIDPQKVNVPKFGKAAGPLGAVGGAAASLTAKDEPE